VVGQWFKHVIRRRAMHTIGPKMLLSMFVIRERRTYFTDHHFGTTIATLAAYYRYQNSAAALTIGSGNLAPGTNIMLNGSVSE
jgi:hypothetical protein